MKLVVAKHAYYPVQIALTNWRIIENIRFLPEYIVWFITMHRLIYHVFSTLPLHQQVVSTCMFMSCQLLHVLWLVMAIDIPMALIESFEGCYVIVWHQNHWVIFLYHLVIFSLSPSGPLWSAHALGYKVSYKPWVLEYIHTCMYLRTHNIMCVVICFVASNSSAAYVRN